MTSSRTRKPVQTPPDAATEGDTDPLADLREPEDLTPRDAEEAEEVEDIAPVEAVTPVEWDQARHLAVVAMHADTTAVGFLHRGGTCGCWYIAGTVLTAILPVQANQEGESEDVG